MADQDLRAAVAAGVLGVEQDYRDLLRSIVDTARAIFGAKASSIFLLDQETGDLVFEAVSGEGSETLIGQRIPQGTGIAGWVVAARQPLVLDDVAGDPRFARDVAEATGYVPSGLMAVPLLHRDEALGVLQVVVAGDSSPAMGAAARVSRLAQNVERAESVRAVKRLQETYAQYSQFGLWTDMAALFADNATLSYGQDSEQGRQAIRNYFLTRFGEGTDGLKPGGLHTQLVFRPLINVSAGAGFHSGRDRILGGIEKRHCFKPIAAGVTFPEIGGAVRPVLEPFRRGDRLAALRAGIFVGQVFG